MDIKVLDHGYVRLVEKWGGDHRVIEAARMSTSGAFKGWEPEYVYQCSVCPYTLTIETDKYASMCPNGCAPLVYQKDKSHRGDAKLLRYLWEHKHMTPFEMAGMVLEVQAPIFVFREWQRHRTQSYNELSARYTELPDMFYIPSVERIMRGKQSQVNKQGSTEGFTESEARNLQGVILSASQTARRFYDYSIGKGLSRELARLVIPVNQYSRMRAATNLRNWCGFLELRDAEGVQEETRDYAIAVARIVEMQFPRTYALFKEGR